MQHDWNKVFNYGVLMSLRVSRWGARKMLRPDELGIEDPSIQEGVSKLFRLGTKRLVDPKHLDVFIKLENKGRRLMKSYGQPFVAVPTAYFVPDRSFAELKPKLDELQQEYMEEAEAFISSYGVYRDEWLDEFYDYARTALSNNSDEYATWFVDRISRYYPTTDQLRFKFGFAYNVFTITQPGDLVDSDDYLGSVEERQAIQQHYRTQVDNQIGQFLQDTVVGLREELMEAATNLKDVLVSGKKFTNRSLAALQSKIDKIKRLNFLDDKRISDTIKELEEYASIDASEYRNSVEFSNEFRSVLTGVTNDLAGTLEEDVDELVADWGVTPKRRLKLVRKEKVEV